MRLGGRGDEEDGSGERYREKEWLCGRVRTYTQWQYAALGIGSKKIKLHSAP